MGKEKKEGRKARPELTGKANKEASYSVVHAGLSLENYAQIYADLCHKNSQPPSASPHPNRLLTRNNLSQVLKIHGFSTFKLNKEALLAGLPHMEMFNPHRSSVDIGDFECDLSKEEMERDLVTLGWVECPSKSVNGFMPFPQSLMSTPNPASTKISDSGKKTSSLTTICANEDCKQLLPLQSTTTTDMQHLSKSVTQMINSGAKNAGDAERFEVATNSCVSRKSKVDDSGAIIDL